MPDIEVAEVDSEPCHECFTLLGSIATCAKTPVLGLCRRSRVLRSNGVGDSSCSPWACGVAQLSSARVDEPGFDQWRIVSEQIGEHLQSMARRVPVEIAHCALENFLEPVCYACAEGLRLGERVGEGGQVRQCEQEVLGI